MTLECTLVRVSEEGNVIGRIVNISADESILDAAGEIDVMKLRPIVFEPVKNGYEVGKSLK